MTAPISSAGHEPKTGSKPKFHPGLEGRGLGAALVGFGAVTLLGLVLYLSPYSWHEPYRPFLSLEWWARPLELNIDAALPEINRPLHAVSVSANRRCVWVAGADALLAFSADNGNSWTPLAYDKDKGTLSTNVGLTEFPCVGAASAPSASLGLIPSAFAQQPAAGGGARPSGVQQGPPPSNNSGAQSAPPNVQQQAPNAKAEIPQPSKGAPALKLSLDSISFPNTAIGTQAARRVSVFNTLPSIAYIGTPLFRPVDDKEPSSPFRLGIGSCAGELNPQGQCFFTIVFDPRVVGRTSWRMEFTDRVGDRYTIDLYGVGRAAPVEKPPDQPPPQPTAGATQQVPGAATNAKLTSPPNFWTIEFESNGNAATLVASGGDIYTTTDGGRTWTGRVADRDRVESGDKMWDRTIPTQPSGSGFVAAAAMPKGVLVWNNGKHIFETENGSTWRQVESKKPEGDLVAMEFNGDNGWAIQTKSGSNVPDQVLNSRDAGATWTAAWTVRDGALKPGSGLYSIHAETNGTDVWVAGYSEQGVGLLFRTEDGGKNWLAATRSAAGIVHPVPQSTSSPWFTNGYVRLPSPGYLLALIFCGYVATRAFREGKRARGNQTETQEESDKEHSEESDGMIGSNVTSDSPLQPGEPDALELGKIANGLAFFLSNPETKPPLVIGINGRWGSGKSSLMNLLQKKLESRGASPIWFNAWHHQQEDQLLAALLQTVKQQALPSPLLWPGISFRARLVINRLKRHWPYILLVALALGLLSEAEARLNAHVPPISVWSLITYFFQFLDTKGPIEQPLTALTSLFAFYGVLSRLLVGFGSNPAALLSSASGRSRQKDLAEQTSFRERFAEEFSDVTTALPPSQRMLILIDDLDRCRPEKVREVMEAVNFLVSSGQCFVVLGMARDMVEHYIGLNFRQIVEGMSWEAMGLTAEDIRRAKEYAATLPDDGKTDRDIFARSLAFARLYLDKLVQIEVTVPEPTPKQMEELYKPEEKEVRKKRKRVALLQSLLAGVRDTVQASVVLGMLVVAVVIAGVALKSPVVDFVTELNKRSAKEAEFRGADARLLNSGLTEIAKSLTQATGSRGGNAPSPGGGGGSPTPPTDRPLGAPGAGATPAPTPGSTPAAIPQGVPIVAGVTSLQFGVVGAWPFGLALLLIGAIALALVLRTPQEDVEDKPVFSQALLIWHPFVMTGGAKNTPRISKRFKNRVRYLAMRQRAIETKDPESAVLKFLRKQLNIPAEPETKEAWKHIPEQMLVAFAAIDDFEPNWIRNAEMFDRISTPKSWEEWKKKQKDGEILDESRYKLLADAQRAAGWTTDVGQLKEYRDAYFKLSNEVAERGLAARTAMAGMTATPRR